MVISGDGLFFTYFLTGNDGCKARSLAPVGEKHLRFGYKTMEQYTLKCKNDPEVHEDEFGMMRYPVKASE